ncbi:hypothetical protein RFI_27628 [Reticulomyxa filosa]|uniref:Uncharacterized protein n=1 Tax=Reticulomyxa filosa TaxID=46433 RepID=X6M745_RETFI|nr:hypothetical protein RFI_27628 [Reticulomyxa filosa]|eukprot:ETO09749.1 hypothetical protein RFI_27628 [Reticulomyxa filosa]
MAEDGRQTQLEELKELVTKTLEKRGVLAKIQVLQKKKKSKNRNKSLYAAQLRKDLYSTLIEQENTNHSVTVPKLFKDDFDFLSFSLIKEYLTFHHLDYTLSIFEVESQTSVCVHVMYFYALFLQKSDIKVLQKGEIAAKLNLGTQKSNENYPLLHLLVEKACNNILTGANNASSGANSVTNSCSNLIAFNSDAIVISQTLPMSDPPLLDNSKTPLKFQPRQLSSKSIETNLNTNNGPSKSVVSKDDTTSSQTKSQFAHKDQTTEDYQKDVSKDDHHDHVTSKLFLKHHSSLVFEMLIVLTGILNNSKSSSASPKKEPGTGSPSPSTTPLPSKTVPPLIIESNKTNSETITPNSSPSRKMVRFSDGDVEIDGKNTNKASFAQKTSPKDEPRNSVLSKAAEKQLGVVRQITDTALDDAQNLIQQLLNEHSDLRDEKTNSYSSAQNEKGKSDSLSQFANNIVGDGAGNKNQKSSLPPLGVLGKNLLSVQMEKALEQKQKNKKEKDFQEDDADEENEIHLFSLAKHSRVFTFHFECSDNNEIDESEDLNELNGDSSEHDDTYEAQLKKVRKVSGENDLNNLADFSLKWFCVFYFQIETKIKTKKLVSTFFQKRFNSAFLLTRALSPFLVPRVHSLGLYLPFCFQIQFSKGYVFLILVHIASRSINKKIFLEKNFMYGPWTKTKQQFVEVTV